MLKKQKAIRGRRRKTGFRRVLKTLFKVAAVGLLVLLVSGIGAWIWLRTPSGTAFVIDQINQALADQGLTLSAGQMEGPLPGRLLLKEAVLADTQGPLLKIKSLGVELKLWALLRGVLHLPLVEIEQPELLRAPLLTSKKPEYEEEAFSLPFGIRLDKLVLSGGKISAGALSSLGVENPELDMNASGQALLEKKQTTLDFTANLHETGAREDLIQAVIKLDAYEAKADQAYITLKIKDRPNGLLGILFKDPDYPGLTLDFQGQGPLNQWLGKADLNYGDAEIEADLNFKSPQGNFNQNILRNPDWQGSLTARLAPGSLLPPPLLKLTGPLIQLELDSKISKGKISGTLKLNGEGPNTIKLEAKAQGDWTPQARQLQIEARLKDLLPDQSKDSAGSLNLTAVVELLQKEIAVKNLSLQGSGLSLTGSVRHQRKAQNSQAKVSLSTGQDSPWVTQGLLLAGLGPNYFCGDLHLKGDINWQGPARPATGELELKGQNIKWGEPALNLLLGSRISLKADLSGGGAGEALKIQVEEFKAGEIKLKGNASYQVAEISDESKVEVELEGALASLTALGQNLKGGLNLKARAQGQLNNLQAELEVSSPEITTTQAVITGLTGRVTGNGTVAGEPEVKGQLTLKAVDSSGGPFTLVAGWGLKPTPQGSELGLYDLSGKLAGVTLTGNLIASFLREITDTTGLTPTVITGTANPLSLDGILNLNIAQWQGLAALTGQKLSGDPAHLELILDSSNGEQRAEAGLELPKLQVGAGEDITLSLQKTSLKFKAQDLFDKLNLDMKLNLGNGRAGPLSWNEGQLQALGQKGFGEFKAFVRQITMKGLNGSRQDGLQLDGTYDLTNETLINLESLNIKLADSGLNLQKPLQILMGEHLKITPLSLKFLPKGEMNAVADFTPGRTKLKAELKDLSYGFFQPLLGSKIIKGQIQNININLAEGHEGITGDFSLATQASIKENGNVINPELKLKGSLSGGTSPMLTVAGELSGGSRWAADGKISGSLPLKRPAAGHSWPTVTDKTPLKATLDFTGPLEPLWYLLGMPDRSLTGMALVELDIGGTVNDPRPVGNMYLAKGRYEDNVLGLVISDINLEAHSTPENLLQAVLSAKDGRGGGLALEVTIKDLASMIVTTKGRFSQFSPLYRDDLSLFFSGEIGAKGPLDKLTLTSDLTIGQGEVDLKILQTVSSIPTLKISKAEKGAADKERPFLNPRLDLKINIPGKLFIRGYGLDSEWGGSLRIEGSVDQPSLVGSLKPLHGYFEFYGKEFLFTNGGLYFNGGTTPQLNMELTNQSADITAIIRIGGSANKPTLAVDSRPPLPQDEIISHILFGKSASSISRFEALQLAATISNLANIGGAGFQIFGLVRKSLGLDVLRLGGGSSNLGRPTSELSGTLSQGLGDIESKGESEDSDSLSVEAGKYLDDNIYVAVEHSDLDGSAISLDVELSPSISLEARTSSKSSQVGLGWKKDY